LTSIVSARYRSALAGTIESKLSVALETEETLRLISRYLRGRRLRILEIGCGGGRLAACLQSVGHKVVAIDTSREAILDARSLGVDARQADIRTFCSDRFDAVLFSRSLHHIHPIDLPLRRARSLLKPGGLLLVQDFCRECMDRTTARWLYRIRGQRTDDPLARWEEEHRHDPPFATGAEMIIAIRREFDEVKTRRSPYLFRYVIQDGKNGLRVLRQEKRLIVLGRLRRIGLYIAASKPRSRGGSKRKKGSQLGDFTG
jgi:SAM-dependent methyltransferase